MAAVEVDQVSEPSKMLSSLSPLAGGPISEAPLDDSLTPAHAPFFTNNDTITLRLLRRDCPPSLHLRGLGHSSRGTTPPADVLLTLRTLKAVLELLLA